MLETLCDIVTLYFYYVSSFLSDLYSDLNHDVIFITKLL